MLRAGVSVLNSPCGVEKVGMQDAGQMTGFVLMRGGKIEKGEPFRSLQTQEKEKGYLTASSSRPRLHTLTGTDLYCGFVVGCSSTHSLLDLAGHR